MTDTATNSPPRLRVLKERPATALDAAPIEATDQAGNETATATDLLALVQLGLNVLSQRAVAVTGQLLPILALGAALWVWRGVMDAPSINQLVGAGLFDLFLLALVVFRRK